MERNLSDNLDELAEQLGLKARMYEEPPSPSVYFRRGKVSARRSRRFPPYTVSMEKTGGGWSVAVYRGGSKISRVGGMDVDEASLMFDRACGEVSEWAGFGPYEAPRTGRWNRETQEWE